VGAAGTEDDGAGRQFAARFIQGGL
jgi:hypothetical protein